MDSEADYGPFLKALSGADPIQARRFAAAKALEIGWGGISKVSAITGISRTTINKGIQEPLELVVNGRVIAKGELVELDGQMGVRIVEIVNPAERLKGAMNS